MALTPAPHRSLRVVYKRLLKTFGPQGWWPVFPGGAGPPAYRPLFYGPRPAEAMFEVCAGAILTQNTAWNNALRALISLDAAASLGPAAISRMDLRTLGGLIRSSGFYRQKAARLKVFSRHLLSRHPEGLKRWFADAYL